MTAIPSDTPDTADGERAGSNIGTPGDASRPAGPNDDALPSGPADQSQSDITEPGKAVQAHDPKAVKTAAAGKSEMEGMQFAVAQFPPPSAGHALLDLARWQTEEALDPVTGPLPPQGPGLRVLRCETPRPATAALRAVATTHDRVLDLEAGSSDLDRSRIDGRSLLQLIDSHLAGITPDATLVVNPGVQAKGSKFWTEAVRDAGAIADRCASIGATLIVLAIGSDVDRQLRDTPGLVVSDVDPWPFIRALAAPDPDVSDAQIEDARMLCADGSLQASTVIAALESSGSGDFAEAIETARQKLPLVEQATSFIDKTILSDNPAISAITFALACFDTLSMREFRGVAQDLVETPDLVEPLATPPSGQVSVAPRIRIDERAVGQAGVVAPRSQWVGSVRMPMMGLRGDRRFRDMLRRQLPVLVPMLSERFMEQMSRRLVHGAVSEQRWDSCGDVIGQLIVNDAGGQTGALGIGLARFWLGKTADGATASAERRSYLADRSVPLLRRLCEKIAALSGLGVATIDVETAVAMNALARADSADDAWRVPVAASFTADILGDPRSAKDLERLVQSILAAPGEVCTILSAMLVGVFGMSARGDGDPAYLDGLLAGIVSIAGTSGESGHRLAAYGDAMTWRLCALRLEADARRLGTGAPPDMPDELAGRLLRHVIDLHDADEESIDRWPTDMRWMRDDRFDHLADGWRPAPPHYDVRPEARSAILRAEASYAASMRALDAITASTSLGNQRHKAIEGFGRRCGLGRDVATDTVMLWLGPSDDDSGTSADPALFSMLFDDNGDAEAPSFVDRMARLRRAIPLLTLAFATASREGEAGSPVAIVLPESFADIVRDRSNWPILCDLVATTRDTLDLILDPWADAIADLPRSPTLAAAMAQGKTNRRVFSAWWSAVGRLRAQPG